MALDLSAALPDLLMAVTDIESVSGNERALADAVEEALVAPPHLTVERDGDAVVARTTLGRGTRVVVAGHLDTVPLAANLPSWRQGDLIYGRGTCDMKGGVTVALAAAAQLSEPRHDVTWIFYDNEEVEAVKNGLGRLARNRPDLLAGDFAVLMEPTGARIEGGCQGTLRFEVTTSGTAAHSARSWLGHNAIHNAGVLLRTLADYEPRTVEVEGLEYREGLNAVGITGGIAGNVIPDRCTITVNFRFAPDRDIADAKAHCAQVFAGHDLVWTDESPAARPGLDRPAAAEFLTAVGGEPRAKYGWTDVARFSALGVPAVNFGPADPGKAHTDDEFCPVADLHACHDALLRWLG
ncbi:succinyl-diaminopimelate desuccinylase [Propioniciclava sinopodophylli]|uniref:Succinyl-diaminopimelate desuccinylase n=1 Tax=Propioniciclava sinopodophylli TaxID=1837344 RepID=A0A4Q9KI71_9ACTN|nr:succinyl-diaminopimelate desuccinylase [Propioniciclava sinopodophylli]TBT87395.1 succinyl-diaminopimelate desuccinylase [Propioniciclava sinopodophylli]